MKNPRIDQLGNYPFWRRHALVEPGSPPRDLKPLALHIGEPKIPLPFRMAGLNG
jgi:hypothetical protein